MTLPKCTDGCFTNDSECLNKKIIKLSPFFKAITEFSCFAFELVIS
jgi:hypothetical protein